MTTTPHKADCTYSRPALILDLSCPRCCELDILCERALADVLDRDIHYDAYLTPDDGKTWQQFGIVSAKDAQRMMANADDPCKLRFLRSDRGK